MKILVTHVPAGSGHEKAAEAVCAALRKKDPAAQTQLLNGLDGMSPWYQWSFTQGYLDMIHRYPHLWGLCYHALDLKGLAWAAYKLHRLSNASHGKVLESILERERPDVVIGTHFFPMEVAAYLKAKGRLKARLITAITDLLPHSVWISPGIDHYAVGAEVTRQSLLERGVPEKNIRVTGIPIHPKFAHQADRAELARKLGLDPKLWTVLICSGGFGTGPVDRLVELLGRVPGPIQILVVTGKNSALRRRLETARDRLSRASHRMVVYGFVDNMEELMDVSDLMVTKPGGLSCAEAMAKGLPLLLESPIPGQEARNARVLEREGIALLARRLEEIPQRIAHLRRHPEQLQAMADKGRRAARPHSAQAVADLALS